MVQSNAVDGQPSNTFRAARREAEANGNIVAVTWSVPKGNFSKSPNMVTLTGGGVSKKGDHLRKRHQLQSREQRHHGRHVRQCGTVRARNG